MKPARLSEIMTVAAAREIKDGDVVFALIGNGPVDHGVPPLVERRTVARSPELRREAA